MKKQNNVLGFLSLEKVFCFLLCIMPLVLYFSYWPVIALGSNETMNFELSLPLIWLVIFDITAAVLVFNKKKTKEIIRGWKWLVFPVFLTLTLAYTRDFARGVLEMGVVWLLYIAVLGTSVLWREVCNDGVRRMFWRVSFGAALASCVWCVVQCILDVAGMEQAKTLLCDGCVYKVFGFPHPNGWAAEPQFMGNLLLLPTMVSAYFAFMRSEKERAGLGFLSFRFLLVCFLVFVATIFLTMSRGAIYALVAGAVVLTIMEIWQMRRCRVLWLWPVMLVGFLLALNLQGVLAEVSPTDDTYISGISKVINQVTLGVVDVGGSQVKKNELTERADGEMRDVMDETEDELSTQLDGEVVGTAGEGAVFDGYVEASTDLRLLMWRAALKTWKQNPQTIMFGVGIGGAQRAMYEYGAIDTTREIINNEYITILLETGVVGVVLFAVTLVTVALVVLKRCGVAVPVLFGVMMAYAVSLCFFSGLPNALHIVLFPLMLVAMWYNSDKKLDKREKGG